jgi:hypothetical protein
MNPGESAAYAAKMRAVLPIIDAHARGERVEYRQTENSEWKEMTSPWWGADPSKYRVKPAPKEVHILYKNDTVWGAYNSRSDANAALTSRTQVEESSNIKNKWEVTTFVSAP